MSKLKLPPISPLIGAGPVNFLRVIAINRHIKPSRWVHIVLSFIIILLATPFRLFDTLYFPKRLKKYHLKYSPLFIIGHWRSGTTFLHNLLSRDKRAAFVTTYHSVFPNHLKSKWLFGFVMRQLMPEYRPGDNIRMGVGYPQEDEYALSNMTPNAFYHAFYFPLAWRYYYEKFIRFSNLSPKREACWKQKYAELVKKACLNTEGAWPVLKNPVNTGRIRQLLALYPEARFVYLVRHPVEVYCSSKKFFSAVIPTLSFQKITEKDISRIILDVYELLLKDYLATRHLIPANRLVEVHYEALLTDPAREIEKIYNRLGMGDVEEMLPSLQNILKKQKAHHPDTYTLTREELENILSRWDFAMKEWNYDVPKSVRIEG